MILHSCFKVMFCSSVPRACVRSPVRPPTWLSVTHSSDQPACLYVNRIASLSAVRSSVRLPFCLTVDLSVYPCRYIYPSTINLWFPRSFCLSVRPSSCLVVFPSRQLSAVRLVCVSTNKLIYLSVCLSTRSSRLSV